MHVNRLRRARARAAVALTSLALLGTAVSAAGPATAAPQAPTAAAPACSTAYKIEQVLDGGTTWRMCWHYNTLSGLVLDNVSYQPKDEPKPIAVLTSARLAQVHVPYDDGENEYDDVTGTDFGYALQNLKPGECPGGTIKTVKVPDRGDVQGLCTTTRARGHAYRLNDDQSTGGSGKVYTAQGKDLLVYTVNKASWYEYITEWRFSSDGTITSNVGATGSLSPYDYNGTDGKGWPIGKGARAYAESHAHNVFWRLDFGLDGSPKSKVEQYDSKVTAPRGSGSPTTKTTRTPVTKELMRRREGHALVAGRQHRGQEQGRPPQVLRVRARPLQQVPGPFVHQARRVLHRVQEVRAVRERQPCRALRRRQRRQVGRRADAHAPDHLGQHRVPPHRPGRGPAADAGPLAGLLTGPQGRDRYESAHSRRPRGPERRAQKRQLRNCPAHPAAPPTAPGVPFLDRCWGCSGERKAVRG